MDLLHHIWATLRHMDAASVGDLASYMGPWLYVLLFGIVFCETGLVVTPLLPGDSLDVYKRQVWIRGLGRVCRRARRRRVSRDRRRASRVRRRARHGRPTMCCLGRRSCPGR